MGLEQNEGDFFYFVEHKRRHFEQYSGHSFYAFTINGILKILKRVQKQLKSGLYELYTMFQVFWCHMRALCEEQTEIKTIFTDNLPLQWTVILCDLISEPVSWSLGQISVFKELNCVFCTQGYYMTSEVYEYSVEVRWAISVMHLWCFFTILLLDKLIYFHYVKKSGQDVL